MANLVHRVPQIAAKSAHVLLDTRRPRSWAPGQITPQNDDGLIVIYDGTGTAPCVTIDSPDGGIELHGVQEIRAVERAFRRARRRAESFGPVLSARQWRALNS